MDRWRDRLLCNSQSGGLLDPTAPSPGQRQRRQCWGQESFSSLMSHDTGPVRGQVALDSQTAAPGQAVSSSR